MIYVDLFLEGQQQGTEASMFTLKGMPKEPEMTSGLQLVLQKYSDLFEVPTQLPPPRL